MRISKYVTKQGASDREIKKVPVLGIESQMKNRQNSFASFGIQYQSIASEIERFYDRYFFDNIGIRRLQHSEMQIEFSFRKLRFPIITGYKFSCNKLLPAVFIGYRPNLLFKWKLR